MTRWMGVFALDELPSEEELLRPRQMQSGNLPFAFLFNNQLASEPESTGSQSSEKPHYYEVAAVPLQLKPAPAAFTLTLNFSILMLCLQPFIH